MERFNNEEYVSFETANILYNKNINIKCLSVYRINDKDFLTLEHFGYIEDDLHKSVNDEWALYAPSLNVSFKYLRDNKNVDIEISVYSSKRDYIVTIRVNTNLIVIDKPLICSTYEEALEAGINESLKYI